MNNYAVEKQFYDYCPIRGCIYHSNLFLSNQNLGNNNENSTHYKMSLIVKNSNISNRTVSLTELKNLFNEVIEIEGIKEYDTVYDDYIYYRNQIINILQTNINPSILDRIVYKYNNILAKYLK